MLQNVVTYGNVSYDRLYYPGDPPTSQRLAAREQGYPFEANILGDFDILNSVYDATFFALPYMEHIVTNDEISRPDLISFRNYRDTDLWSFILMFNRIADPMNGLYIGQVLKLPNYDRLTSWLTRKLIQEKRK